MSIKEFYWFLENNFFIEFIYFPYSFLYRWTINTYRFISFLLIPLTHLYFLNALARNSSNIKNSDNHLCLVSDLKWNACQVFPLKVCFKFLAHILHQIKDILFYYFSGFLINIYYSYAFSEIEQTMYPTIFKYINF